MVVLRHPDRLGRRFPSPVLTFGSFDGVHRGHQEILRRLVARARALSGSAVLLTFSPHPLAVLGTRRAPLLLDDWRARLRRLEQCGVDVAIVQRFTPAFAALTAREFVCRLLVERLEVRHVVVGNRVGFGHGRDGDADTLRNLGAEFGFGVDIVGPVEVDGTVVSSSAARRAISGGEIDLARELLGRAPTVSGRVVHGCHRGRGLGFPTANLRVAGRVLPPDGVYAVRARVSAGDRWRDGVANLGFNPTFGDGRRSLETHVFDFAEELYGRWIEVGFARRLRGEMRFPSPAALAEQIAGDVAAARRALEETAPW